MSERTCGNCRWWNRHSGPEYANDVGECRRHAPAASARHADARWTTTWETDWCGEWADKIITPEPEHDPSEDHELEAYVSAVRELVPDADRWAVVNYWRHEFSPEVAAEHWKAFCVWLEKPEKEEQQ